MTRRAFVSLALVLGATASVAPEALPVRKVEFLERGGHLVMRARLPALLRAEDRGALADLSSGFSTRFVYRCVLYKWERGARQRVRTIERRISAFWDPWTQHYVTDTSEGHAPVRRRSYRNLDGVIDAVVELDIAVASVHELVRGSKEIYFAHVIAQRNPLDGRDAGDISESGDLGPEDVRGSLAVFTRWISLFARERPPAEVHIEFRTNYVYLEPI